jgi:hypothetical protein
MAMREIRETIGGNKAMLPAWQRAVTDYLINRITTRLAYLPATGRSTTPSW